MSWLFELHKTQPAAHAIGALAFVCVLGMALGSLKFRGIGLGTAGVLFAGIVVGHFGNPVDQHTLHFVKEFGLMLFVFTIGLQLGPGFAAARRDQGVKLNLLAAAIVILGAIGAPLIGVRVDAIPGRIESRVTISRVCSGEGIAAATDATVIHKDDRLAVVGTRAGLEQFERVVGRRSDEDLLLQESDITYRRVVVTDRDALGKTVGELNLDDRFGVAVTRVTRADLEMTAVPGLRLQFGDPLHIVGRDEDLG